MMKIGACLLVLWAVSAAAQPAPPARERRKTDVRLELRFADPTDAKAVEVLLQGEPSLEQDALFKSALACTAKAKPKDGGRRVLCSRVREGSDGWWCCEDADSKAETCEPLSQGSYQAELLAELLRRLPEGYNDSAAFFVDKSGDELSMKDLRSGKASIQAVFRVCSSASRSCSLAHVDELLKELESAWKKDDKKAPERGIFAQ